MITRGSESKNRLFAATVTTGAMAAMAAASFGFYTHDAVARLLLRSADNNAVNARVEDKLSKMEQSMQQQHHKAPRKGQRPTQGLTPRARLNAPRKA